MEANKFDLLEGKYLYQYDLPVKLNHRRHKLWLAKIVDYAPKNKFPLQLKWLESVNKLDGKTYYDVEQLKEGDFIKVKCVKNGYAGIETLIVSEKTEKDIQFETVLEETVIKEMKKKDFSSSFKEMLKTGAFPSLSEEDKKKMLSQL